MPDPDDGGDDADCETPAYERLALLDMCLQISDMPPAFCRRARPASQTHIAQGVPHGPAAAAVARRVDVRVGYTANIGSAAQEMAEMSFLIAPCSDFDSAFCARIGIDHAGGFKGIDDAKRPIEPARVILAFKVRPGQQFCSGFCAGAEHVADAVDRSGEPGFRKLLGQPLQRSHMRFGESRLVNARLVCANATERIKIRKNPSTIDT